MTFSQVLFVVTVSFVSGLLTEHFLLGLKYRAQMKKIASVMKEIDRLEKLFKQK